MAEQLQPSWSAPETSRLAGRTAAGWPGRGRGCKGESHGYASPVGIKLLPVFTFRMNTFPSWPGSLSIFETFVSKISHFWVVMIAVREASSSAI